MNTLIVSTLFVYVVFTACSAPTNNTNLNQRPINWLLFCLWPGRRGLPVREGGSEPVGRAGPVGVAASQTPWLPHPDLQADPRSGSRRAGPGPPNLHTVNSGPSKGTQLPAGPGLPPPPAPVLLHHGARPAGAAAPKGHSGSGCAGEAEVDGLAVFGSNC